MCVFSHVQLFWDPVDGNPPGSSIHGTSQARILEWVAISFSRGLCSVATGKKTLKKWETEPGLEESKKGKQQLWPEPRNNRGRSSQEGTQGRSESAAVITLQSFSPDKRWLLLQTLRSQLLSDTVLALHPRVSLSLLQPGHPSTYCGNWIRSNLKKNKKSSPCIHKRKQLISIN